MATIIADDGVFHVTIKGEEHVESIDTGDNLLDSFFKKNIAEGKGRIANNYRPKPNTMLQAYAFCANVFNEKNVSVDGYIGEMPYEPGVIY